MSKHYRSGNRPIRSDKYQYLIVETVCDYEFLSKFSNSQSIESMLNPYQYNEILLDAYDKLKKRFWELAFEALTPRQKNVVLLYMDGYTQTEIAKILDINQSSVTKALNGNTDYKGDPKGRTYGGLIKKMKKLVLKDPEILRLLEQINELREEKI